MAKERTTNTLNGKTPIVDAVEAANKPRETRLQRLERELREEREREKGRATKQLATKREELERAENNIARWESIRDARKAEIKELEELAGIVSADAEVALLEQTFELEVSGS